ncbi:MAG TPA: hypothetical protein VMS77_04270 [Conexivisphaerales archaeon]|nr:hypothetical protein [Conexivisphaerales archaeon]
MASMALSIGVFAVVVMLFVAGFAFWQYYTVSSENSDLRKTLNATQVDNTQLRSQVNSLQQQVTSLQSKVNELEAAGGSEKLNISSATAMSLDRGGWEVNLTGLNSGSANATINQILVNGGPTNESWLACAGDGCTVANATSLVVLPGSSFTVLFHVEAPPSSFGQTVDVRVATTAGSYRVEVVLPGGNVQSESISVYVANATATTSPATSWALAIAGRNTASSNISFNKIEVNGVTVPTTVNVSVNGNTAGPFVNASVSAGNGFTIALNLTATGFGNLTFTTGQTINLTLVTGRGSYHMQVLLPASAQYENLQVSTSYAVASGSGNWAVIVGGYNAGTSPATVQQVLVNGQVAGSLGGAMVMSSMVDADMVSYPGTLIPAGSTFNYIISVFGVSAGQSIQVKIVTAQGTYPVAVPTS